MFPIIQNSSLKLRGEHAKNSIMDAGSGPKYASGINKDQ